MEPTKQSERQRLIKVRLGVSPDQASSWSAAIHDSLLTELDRKRPDSLAVYLPIRGEPDLTAYYPDYSKKCRLALPVCGENGRLQFISWQPGQALRVGEYGIAVPVAGQAVSPDMILLPCVGFNRAGYRLGYGGGWFDKTLPDLRSDTRLIGISYACLHTEDFFAEPHDVPLHAILTEQGFLERT